MILDFAVTTVVNGPAGRGQLGAASASDLTALDGRVTVLEGDAAQLEAQVDSLTTSHVPEGSNLYYTEARARAALSGAAPITYNNGTGAIGANASSANTADYLVQRDGTGGFSAADVTVTNLTDSALTPGSVVFAGAGGLLAQDNANFFWDDTNNRLGIGTASPSERLDILGGVVRLRTAAGTGAGLWLDGAGTNNLFVGMDGATNIFRLYSATLGANALVFDLNAGTFHAVCSILSLDPGAAAQVDVAAATGKAIRMYAGSYATGPAFQLWPTGTGLQGMYFDAGSATGADIHFRASPGGTDYITLLQGSGRVGIGSVVAPTARLHLAAGTATASTAPLKFETGTLLGAVENGAVEFNGTNLYLTAGGVRAQLTTGAAYVHPNHSGDVTSVADGATTIAANAVTFAKFQTIATDKILGRDTVGTGNVETLDVSGGLEFTGTGIQRSALTGDVTATAGLNATTIAADAVTFAKMQNISAASRLVGRGSAAGAGDPEEITLGTNLSLSGTTLNAAAAALTAATVTVPYGTADALIAVADALVTGVSKILLAFGHTAQTDTNDPSDAVFSVESVAAGTFNVRVRSMLPQTIGGPYQLHYLLG